MKRKLLVLILALCLTVTNSMAQETGKGFDDDKDLPSLNKFRRSSVRRLNAIENGVSLTSGVTGILPLANGGTGAALVDPDVDKIFFWDDSEGTTSLLTIGTGLTITGTTISAGTPGLTLISTTTHAGASNTGDIAIEPSKKYLVTLDIDNATATTSNVYLRFNSSSTATGYAWAGTGTKFNTTPTQTITGDESDDAILIMEGSMYLGEMATVANNGFLKGHMIIDTNKVSTVYSAMVNGQGVADITTTGVHYANFAGVNQEDITIADFELVFSVNMAFTIKVYELD